MPIEPDMMKAVEAENERRKLTEPEHVERLAKEIAALGSREAQTMPSGWEDAYWLYDSTAATLRALSAMMRETKAAIAEARREALREMRAKWLVRDLTQSDFIDPEAPAPAPAQPSVQIDFGGHINRLMAMSSNWANSGHSANAEFCKKVARDLRALAGGEANGSHDNSEGPPRGEPDFSEAANDFATALLEAEAPAQPKPELDEAGKAFLRSRALAGGDANG